MKNPRGLPTALGPRGRQVVPVSEVHLDLRRFRTSFDFINNYFPHDRRGSTRVFLLYQFSSLPYGNSDYCIDINRFAIVTSNLSASLISKRTREKEHNEN